MSVLPCQETRTASPARLYHTALQASLAGIGCLPIRADGTKRPAIHWKAYQQRRPTLAEIQRWFREKQAGEIGMAFLTGQISGGLELVDFDTPTIYEAWASRMRVAGLAPLLTRLEQGYWEETPHGVHLLYRCRQVQGNQKLAQQPADGGVQVLIETRGEGGYGIVAPSCGAVHPSGRPYCLRAGGIETIPVLSVRERTALLTVARTLDAMPAPSVWHPSPLPARGGTRRPPDGLRPGDWFNQHVRWEDLLPRYGWEHVSTRGEEGYWRRPGKQGPGVSATTNYAGLDRLYVFSTATVFEAGRSYTKFRAYTILAHGGDVSAAARAVAAARAPGAILTHRRSE